jgi:mannose-6-phosphate isomerase-like protein (cupin superfamily)
MKAPTVGLAVGLALMTSSFATGHAATEEPLVPHKIQRETAEHYVWGGTADGWHFLKRDDLSIIDERVPSGVKEVMHHHKVSRQFFYVTKGEGVMGLESGSILLKAGEGLEVPPGTWHQFRNESSADVEIVVVSMPPSHGDKFSKEN